MRYRIIRADRRSSDCTGQDRRRPKDGLRRRRLRMGLRVSGWRQVRPRPFHRSGRRGDMVGVEQLPPSCANVCSTTTPVSRSSIASDCWLACKSHPISLISASFQPERGERGRPTVYADRFEVDVVMTSMFMRVNARCAHQVRPPPSPPCGIERVTLSYCERLPEESTGDPGSRTVICRAAVRCQSPRRSATRSFFSSPVRFVPRTR